MAIHGIEHQVQIARNKHPVSVAHRVRISEMAVHQRQYGVAAQAHNQYRSAFFGVPAQAVKRKWLQPGPNERVGQAQANQKPDRQISLMAKYMYPAGAKQYAQAEYQARECTDP